jgi:hypothetical protein
MSNPEFTAPDYTSQDAATYKANIDASIAANGADAVNIGFSYDVGTGTFTIHDAKGSALSASNPGFVRVQDKANPGYSKYISVEANQSFIDDNGASEIINNLFGYDSGTAVTDARFFLYGVANDDMDTIRFMIGKVSHLRVSPATANIGAPDDAVADAATDLWSLDNIDETTYDTNPCTCIGSFRMSMSASDDWTVQTLDLTDGISVKFQSENSEGLFTPTISADTVGSLSVTYDEQVGTWSRDGNYVDFTIIIQTNTVSVGTASGSLRVEGFPFTFATLGAGARDQLAVVETNGLDVSTVPMNLTANCNGGETYITIIEVRDAASRSVSSIGDLSSGDDIVIHGRVKIA